MLASTGGNTVSQFLATSSTSFSVPPGPLLNSSPSVALQLAIAANTRATRSLLHRRHRRNRRVNPFTALSLESLQLTNRLGFAT
jgi:hypothetical protein